MTVKYSMFSVERLFYDLMKSGHPALDPLVITPNGLLSIKDDVLESPQRLCTILHGHRYFIDDCENDYSRHVCRRESSLSFMSLQR